MTRVETRAVAGRRLVLVLYGIVVALATTMGFAIGIIAPRDMNPRLFGLVTLPPTPFGMAVYGAVTIAVGLGVLLGLVVIASRRYAE